MKCRDFLESFGKNSKNAYQIVLPEYLVWRDESLCYESGEVSMEVFRLTIVSKLFGLIKRFKLEPSNSTPSLDLDLDKYCVASAFASIAAIAGDNEELLQKINLQKKDCLEKKKMYEELSQFLMDKMK